MFTGLVKMKARVCELKKKEQNSLELWLQPLMSLKCKIGDSISVNGVCLTLARKKKTLLCFEVSPETLARSSLGKLKTNSLVNLEPALRANESLGGHWVQAHIDEVGKILRIKSLGKYWQFRISFSKKNAHLIVEKGSICVDGVSLTLNQITKSSFDVMIIPHTFKETCFGGYRVGDQVNLEFDILGKYLERYLKVRRSA